MITRKNGRAHGEVFTETSVVQFILDEVGYSDQRDLSTIRILEPAAGHGAFAAEIIRRLYTSSKKFHFDFAVALHDNVRVNELNKKVYQTLRNMVCNLAHSIAGEKTNCDKILINSDFLEMAHEKFDCIVGNPPYIRHELIPEENKLLYRKKFGTFKNRADLYIPFFEHALHLLNDNGLLCFICSNRWLYNQSGQPLRQLIAEDFHLRKLTNIEQSSPFDESVIAYPCIATIQNKRAQKKTLYFESSDKNINFFDIKFKTADSPTSSDWGNLFLYYDMHHSSLVGIEDQGFKIGIGVATGADAVFILQEKDINKIEKSRLLPIITARDLTNNTLNWKRQYVINPFDSNKLCNLDHFPHLKEYLLKNKDSLLARHIAKKSADRWYQTIDKINPGIQQQNKILLPDLSGNSFIFIDEGTYYPHHNIYYITGPDLRSLKILACLLMSDFVKHQLSRIGIKMNGGLPRFQSQVLRKIKIPDIKKLSRKTQDILEAAYDAKDFEAINMTVQSFCSEQEVFAGFATHKISSSPMRLF